MSRNRLPAIVEVLTGISIVASLILLTMEVRANTKALDRQIRLDRAQAISQPVLEYQPVLEAYQIIKARDGREAEVQSFMDAYGLSEAQAIAWTRLLARTWMELEADFRYMGRDPVLRATVVGRLSFPDNLLYWESARDGFTADFVSFVEAMRAYVPTGSDPDSPPGG
jgi:hypothetical protein